MPCGEEDAVEAKWSPSGSQKRTKVKRTHVPMASSAPSSTHRRRDVDGGTEDHGERYGEKRRLERVREGARAKDERRPRARVQEQYPMRWQSVADRSSGRRAPSSCTRETWRRPRPPPQRRRPENGIRNFEKAHW